MNVGSQKLLQLRSDVEEMECVNKSLNMPDVRMYPILPYSMAKLAPFRISFITFFCNPILENEKACHGYNFFERKKKDCSNTHLNCFSIVRLLVFSKYSRLGFLQ